jgi:hypothetical protein
MSKTQNRKARETVRSRQDFAQICICAGLSAKQVAMDAKDAGIQPEAMARQVITNRRVNRALV